MSELRTRNGLFSTTIPDCIVPNFYKRLGVDYTCSIKKNARADRRNGMSREVAVIGLGYAGLQTALGFGRKKLIMGYDRDSKRISELKNGYDRTNTFSQSELAKAEIAFTNSLEEIKNCTFFIIVVPTDIDKRRRPDLSHLENVSRDVGQILKKDDIIVFESTVDPGTTEEICVPLLEKYSNLKFNKDFSVGYSPERINPGDKERSFANTPKVVSGSDSETLAIIYQEYQSVIDAQVITVSNIKTAEAVKITENVQRDVNIALINEIATIFHKLDIDTEEVLNAAKTKWNFIPFKPGLVGGHCIGVDSYYLINRARLVGVLPRIMLAARETNEKMASYIVRELIKLLLRKKKITNKTAIGILGITYKQDCNDIRNSKVASLYGELVSYGVAVSVCDPLAPKKEVKKVYGINLVEWTQLSDLAAIIIAVPHEKFRQFSAKEYASKLVPGGVIMDIKGCLNASEFSSLGITVWRL